MIMNIRNRMKSQKGFTLVELMVVIAIIGILAAIAVPKLNTSSDSAKKAKILADLRTIDSANAVCYADTGSYKSITDLKTAKYLANEPAPKDYGSHTGLTYTVNTTATDANYGRAYVSIGTDKYYSTDNLPN